MPGRTSNQYGVQVTPLGIAGGKGTKNSTPIKPMSWELAAHVVTIFGSTDEKSRRVFLFQSAAKLEDADILISQFDPMCQSLSLSLSLSLYAGKYIIIYIDM